MFMRYGSDVQLGSHGEGRHMVLIATDISGPLGGFGMPPHLVTSLTNGRDGPSLGGAADVNRLPPRMVQTVGISVRWRVSNEL